MEREDVVHVLRRFRELLVPDRLLLDLQVIPPDPVVELDGRALCAIDGEPILATAEAAAAEIDRMVESGLLLEEGTDDHDVLKHYSSGRVLVEDFAGKERTIPTDAIPRLESVDRTLTVRERCRSRRLRVAGR